MMYFPGTSYNPYGTHAPQADKTPDVPLAQFRAAQRAGASHLSADGKYVYTVRYDRVLQAAWNGSCFGAWLDIGEEMPADAVRM